jgi:ATP-binding cassette subfamily B protein
MFLRYHRPQITRLAFLALLTAAQSLLLIPVLLLVRFAFDTAIPQRAIDLLLLTGLAIIGIRAVGTGVALVVRRLGVAIIKRIISRWREDLLTTLYARPREFLSRSDLDRLQTRVVQESERADGLSHMLFLTLMPTSLSAVTLLLLLAWLDWQLTLAALVCAPVLLFASQRTSDAIKHRVNSFQEAFETYNKGVSFVLRQMDLTRTQGYEKAETKRQLAHIDHLRETGEAMSFSFAVHRQIQSTLIGIGGIALLILGGAKVALGDMTLGALLSFYLAAMMLNGFAGTLLGALPEMVASDRSLTKLREILADGRTMRHNGPRQITFGGEFALEGVGFSYEETPVLRDVSLRIKPGERIAIIGANGAGKSTLLNIMLGLSAPHAGRIFADGIDYEELDLSEVRRQIGTVLQRTGFFRGTLRENIAYGSTDVTEFELATAIRRAGAETLIASLPNGLDTILGENGVTLSGGEAQRLALARAFLRNPRVLILDEPTNHLDVDAVAAILKTIAGQAQRPTIILVSHDPRIVAFADTVYRLEQGRLRRESRAETTPEEASTNGEAIA